MLNSIFVTEKSDDYNKIKTKHCRENFRVSKDLDNIRNCVWDFQKNWDLLSNKNKTQIWKLFFPHLSIIIERDIKRGQGP